MRRVPWFLELASASLAIVLVGSPPARAQMAGPADIDLSVRVEPQGVLLPGTTARVIVDINNLGPGDAEFVYVLSSFYPAFGPGQLFNLYPTAQTAPCQFSTDHVDPVPGNPLPLVAILTVGSLAAGQALRCELELIVWPEARGNFDLYFTVRLDDRFNTDPYFANNTVKLPLTFSRTSVAVPTLGAWPLVALGMLLAIAAAIPRRAARNSSR